MATVRGFPSLSSFPPYHNIYRPVRQALPSLFHEFSGVTEDSLKHLPCEPAGKSVLLTRVIRAKEEDSGQGKKLAVPETGDGRGNRQFQLASRAEIGSKGNLPESDHHADLGEHSEFLQQIRSAGAKLYGRGLVIGRSAVYCRSDIAIAQLQTIIFMGRCWLVGKSGQVQGLIKPVTTAVAGEDSAGAVTTMCGRRQANNQESSLRITKAGHRSPPIIPVTITFDLLARHLLAVSNETRTEGAADDTALDLRKQVHDSGLRSGLIAAQAKRIRVRRRRSRVLIVHYASQACALSVLQTEQLPHQRAPTEAGPARGASDFTSDSVLVSNGGSTFRHWLWLKSCPPEPQGFVTASRNDGLAIWRKGNACNCSVVADKGADFLPGRHLPEFHHSVSPSGC